MTGATTAHRQDEANKALRNTNYTHPAIVYLSLFTTATTDAGGGTEVANANAYARTAVTFGAPNSSGVCTNSVAVTFPTPAGSWGTATHGALMTSGTYGAGAMMFHGPLDASLDITGASTVVTFPIGSISVQFGS